MRKKYVYEGAEKLIEETSKLLRIYGIFSKGFEMKSSDKSMVVMEKKLIGLSSFIDCIDYEDLDNEYARCMLKTKRQEIENFLVVIKEFYIFIEQEL